MATSTTVAAKMEQARSRIFVPAYHRTLDAAHSLRSHLQERRRQRQHRTYTAEHDDKEPLIAQNTFDMNEEYDALIV